MFAWIAGGRPTHEIIEMNTRDADVAARLHGLSFSRGWSDGEFASLLSQPSVFGFLAHDPARPRMQAAGFVLAREVAGEAEILSIGVAPPARKTGLGWRLMQAAMREAAHRGGEEIFLEVDESNDAAIALYRKLGFAKAGERRAYYQHPDQPATSAWIMRRAIAEQRKPGR